MILNLDRGWSVLQDVHGLGETFEIQKEGFDPTRFGGLPGVHPMAPWTPLDRLEHLQLSLAENPYYGKGLREFNHAPWWYKQEFAVPADVPGHAVLTFHGADYFADVWLNGEYLGGHEGYNTAFRFEAGALLRREGLNRLIVKVRSPWDQEILPGLEYIHFCTMIRDMMKGTYEHSDTFIPRDVNPIGIWKPVTLEFYDGLRLEDTPCIHYTLAEDNAQVQVEFSAELFCPDKTEAASLRIEITHPDDEVPAAVWTGEIAAEAGLHAIRAELNVENPRLWTVWERGIPNLYTVRLILCQNGAERLLDRRCIGFRRISLRRTPEECTYYLNGERIYLRGTAYFPDVYISAVTDETYVRDIDNAVSGGMNTLRVHVHAEHDAFYELCDRRGILVMQDTDFNWVHPAGEEWGRRAVQMARELFARLRNHPSIFCWVLLNEPRGDNFLYEWPGPQLKSLIEEMDPDGTYILSSWSMDEPLSGDSHNYTGSLDGAGTHYLDVLGSREKLNTEFGFDALPCYATLRQDPELLRLLGPVSRGIEEIQYYQYRFLKFNTERYRIQKWNRCAGYYQFLFSDPAPTSHFGIYDRRGLPKLAHRVLKESNQPLGIFLEISREGAADIWVVNDLLRAYPGARALWSIADAQGNRLHHWEQQLDLPANDALRVSALDFSPLPGCDYTLRLRLYSAEHVLLAENLYEKAFTPPAQPKGHPDKMHHGIGLRMYWAWDQAE